MDRNSQQAAGTDTGASRDSGSDVILFARTCERAGTASAVVRPRATFIAQLIAANENVPQYRVLRRAEPQAASAAYRSAIGHSDIARQPSRLTPVTA